jgi:oligopeptide transport system substrate-binding protein
MVTLGPYELTYHDLDQQYGFTANARYYGQRGNIKKFVALIVKDDAAAIKLYQEGKIDFLNDIPVVDLKLFMGKSDLKTFPYLKTDYLAFSTNLYPFDTATVRRAFAMAINRSEIKNVIYQSRPAGSFVPPPLMGSSDALGVAFDPAKAKAALDSTGLDYHQQKFTLSLPDWPTERLVAEFVRGQLKKNLGVELELAPMTNKAFRMNLELHSSPLFLGHWAADYPDADNFVSIFLSDSGANRFSWKSSVYDQLVVSASDLTDKQKRKDLYAQAQKLLIQDEAVVIPLFYEPKVALVQPRVHGLVVNPVGYLLLSGVNVDR